MGSRLIFRPVRLFRWSDGGDKTARLNGLTFETLRSDDLENPVICVQSRISRVSIRSSFYLANAVEEPSEKNF